MKTLQEMLKESSSRRRWLQYTTEGGFFIARKKPQDKCLNREVLAHVYQACVQQLQQLHALKEREANQVLRLIWRKMIKVRSKKALPGIIRSDGFLLCYALGMPLSMHLMTRLYSQLHYKPPKLLPYPPIHVQWNLKAHQFFDVVGAPPGFLSKFFTSIRLRRDEALLNRIGRDLSLLSEIEDSPTRLELTLALLSHAAAYRELEGKQLAIPSFTQPHKLVVYQCMQHLIEEGVKTISLMPPDNEPQAPGIYLCQGTELWPSQRSALGSIVANFAIHGSATEAYAHSWRRIHKHLRDLRGSQRPLPLIAGHSMGGALAMQIGLYSHELVGVAYAFNPPMPNERDFCFYHQLPIEIQAKIQVWANLDDFAFWRIGAKVIGQVTLFLGKIRWRYYPLTFLDTVFVLPAIVKLALNLVLAFPAHQHVMWLRENFLMLKLTQEEIAQENQERATRFDYLRFFPKLYDPMRVFLRGVRRLFGWSLEVEYVRNEIEIVLLHECDLRDAMTPENRMQIELELEELKRQKEQLFRRLSQVQRNK